MSTASTAIKQIVEPTKTVFVVRLEAPSGAAGIHGLRWLLKSAWRRHKLKCVGLAEQQIDETSIPRAQSRQRRGILSAAQQRNADHETDTSPQTVDHAIGGTD
jgi:hypothetical protein